MQIEVVGGFHACYLLKLQKEIGGAPCFAGQIAALLRLPGSVSSLSTRRVPSVQKFRVPAHRAIGVPAHSGMLRNVMNEEERLSQPEIRYFHRSSPEHPYLGTYMQCHD